MGEIRKTYGKSGEILLKKWEKWKNKLEKMEKITENVQKKNGTNGKKIWTK